MTWQQVKAETQSMELRIAALIPEALVVSVDQNEKGGLFSCDEARHRWKGITRVILVPGADVEDVARGVEEQFRDDEGFEVTDYRDRADALVVVLESPETGEGYLFVKVSPKRSSSTPGPSASPFRRARTPAAVSDLVQEIYAHEVSARRIRLGAGTIVVLALVVVAAACVLTGLLPAADAGALGARVTPVLGFVVAITIVAELARDAAVFDVLAQRLARWGSGRVIALWASVVALAVVSTVFLSLDTTAVIVTPVVVVLAQSIGVSPLPFALATVWLANTASLALPVSNLTNLLAAPAIGSDPGAFLALSWAPTLVGVLIPVAILTVVHRRTLFGTYRVPRTGGPSDRLLFWGASGVLIVLLPLLTLTHDVWIPATAAAVLLLGLFAIRRPHVLRPTLVPWQAIGLATALFVLVETAHANGILDFLAFLASNGHDPGELLRLAGIGALTANGVNNLPAYLILEPIATDPVALMALLIGVNLGPLITPWASLATLLWHHRIVSLGVEIRWGRFMLWGLVVAVPTVVVAAISLALVSG